MLDSNADALAHFVKGIKFWDTCAADALLKARYGCVTNKDGEDIYYDHTLPDYTL